MTSGQRLSLIRVKIDRAKKHFEDLNLEVQNFFDSNPYVVGTKRQPETRRLVYYLASVRQTPAQLAAITGDVLQNLRGALDHLAFQLLCLGTAKQSQLARDVYFPIFDSFSQCGSRLVLLFCLTAQLAVPLRRTTRKTLRVFAFRDSRH